MIVWIQKILRGKKKIGRVQWFTPAIPALWEAEVGRSRGQVMEAIPANMVKPHLHQKYKKPAGCGGLCLSSQLPRRLRQEDHQSLGGGGCRAKVVPLHSSLGDRARLPSQIK